MAVDAAPARDDTVSVATIRGASAIVLLAYCIFLPLETTYTDRDDLGVHLVLYGVTSATVLGGFLLTFLPWGERHTDALGVALSLVLAASTLGYFWVSPQLPTLVAMGLTLLLVGSAVLGLWSVGRTTVIGIGLTAAYAAIGVLRAPPDPVHGSFAFSVAALAVGVAVAFACAVGFARVRVRLDLRQRELTELSSRLMSIQEEERARLSRELHDELGQSLTAVLSYLWLVEKQLPAREDELHGRVAEARRLASKTLTQIRELSQLLRPSVLDDYGLVPSLDQHVKAFADREQLLTSFTAATLPHRLSREVETAVYRITQEALTNVARHARARSVQVTLGVEGDRLRLEVEDDGVGLRSGRHAGPARAGVGLIGIRERVRALGGTVQMGPANGGQGPGARLEVWLPLEAER
ncbi:MAG: sensor histidine kinase [bacterium]|nr:sensor histidine kinase [bacterium]